MAFMNKILVLCLVAFVCAEANRIRREDMEKLARAGLGNGGFGNLLNNNGLAGLLGGNFQDSFSSSDEDNLGQSNQFAFFRMIQQIITDLDAETALMNAIIPIITAKTG